MGILRVRTASGKKQRFNPKKLHRTCIRAGAHPGLADNVVREVGQQLYDGIPTSKILQLVLDALRRNGAADVASRYDLKHAIMRMGPTGFVFETFLAEVLENYGYQTYLRQKVKGLCVEHEIDIILVKDGERFMVEVKYHNAPGIYTGLKEAMYTYSRFLELKEGHEAGTCERFDRAWLATNTRSSLEARRYAAGRGIRLLGWRYPRNGGIEKMIERKGLFPVTVLQDLKQNSLDALNRANMMLVNDLCTEKPQRISDVTGLPLDEVKDLVLQSRVLVEDAGISSTRFKDQTHTGLTSRIANRKAPANVLAGI